MTQQLILIAGPYRSGTDGLQARIDENLARLENAALAVYQRGHVPVIGEWLALPLAKAAGSTSLGDDIAESMLYPVAHRLTGSSQNAMRFIGLPVRLRGRIWTLKWPGNLASRFILRWRAFLRLNDDRASQSSDWLMRKPVRPIPLFRIAYAPSHDRYRLRRQGYSLRIRPQSQTMTPY